MAGYKSTTPFSNFQTISHWLLIITAVLAVTPTLQIKHSSVVSAAAEESRTSSSSNKASWRTSPDVPASVTLWHEDGSVGESSALHWEPVHDLKDFSFAVEAGGSHNSWQYVCRARQDGEWVPGRGTSSRVCYVPWKGREYAHTSFQVGFKPSHLFDFCGAYNINDMFEILVSRLQ
jgi:hypothetical protein